MSPMLALVLMSRITTPCTWSGSCRSTAVQSEANTMPNTRTSGLLCFKSILTCRIVKESLRRPCSTSIMSRRQCMVTGLWKNPRGSVHLVRLHSFCVIKTLRAARFHRNSPALQSHSRDCLFLQSTAAYCALLRTI
jgi:hypothetical protein